MPAETLNEMILGFAVILGVLVMYIITLILRTRGARIRCQQKLDK
jgi:hypothetical protein